VKERVVYVTLVKADFVCPLCERSGNEIIVVSSSHGKVFVLCNRCKRLLDTLSELLGLSVTAMSLESVIKLVSKKEEKEG